MTLDDESILSAYLDDELDPDEPPARSSRPWRPTRRCRGPAGRPGDASGRGRRPLPARAALRPGPRPCSRGSRSRPASTAAFWLATAASIALRLSCSRPIRALRPARPPIRDGRPAAGRRHRPPEADRRPDPVRAGRRSPDRSTWSTAADRGRPARARSPTRPRPPRLVPRSSTGRGCVGSSRSPRCPTTGARPGRRAPPGHGPEGPDVRPALARRRAWRSTRLPERGRGLRRA